MKKIKLLFALTFIFAYATPINAQAIDRSQFIDPNPPKASKTKAKKESINPEASSKGYMLIGPNPSRGEFLVKTSMKNPSLNIFDVDGFPVEFRAVQQGKNEFFVSLADQSAGYYRVEASNSKGKMVSAALVR
jgi:hypothetical protein